MKIIVHGFKYVPRNCWPGMPLKTFKNITGKHIALYCWPELDGKMFIGQHTFCSGCSEIMTILNLKVSALLSIQHRARNHWGRKVSNSLLLFKTIPDIILTCHLKDTAHWCNRGIIFYRNIQLISDGIWSLLFRRELEINIADLVLEGLWLSRSKTEKWTSYFVFLRR